jgi:hypothetical protein
LIRRNFVMSRARGNQDIGAAPASSLNSCRYNRLPGIKHRRSTQPMFAICLELMFERPRLFLPRRCEIRQTGTGLRPR